VMVRYYIFSGLQYYPEGGAHDLVGSFASSEGDAAAVEIVKDLYADNLKEWWHLARAEEGKLAMVKGGWCTDGKVEVWEGDVW